MTAISALGPACGMRRVWQALSLGGGWAGRATAALVPRCRGRSGLHRTRWWATPTRGNPRDQCHREQTASSSGGGKGETGVQETTSTAGDRRGSRNPTWSKANKRGNSRRRARGRSARAPREVAGGVRQRPPEMDGRQPCRRRRYGEQNPAYEPAHPHPGLRPKSARLPRCRAGWGCQHRGVSWVRTWSPPRRPWPVVCHPEPTWTTVGPPRSPPALAVGLTTMRARPTGRSGGRGPGSGRSDWVPERW